MLLQRPRHWHELERLGDGFAHAAAEMRAMLLTTVRRVEASWLSLRSASGAAGALWCAVAARELLQRYGRASGMESWSCSMRTPRRGPRKSTAAPTAPPIA